VESVADAVAILHQGRIVRCGETESLRDDVKQFVLSVDSVAGMIQPDGLLDVRRHDDRLILVADQSGRWIEQFISKGIDHEVMDLSLDEIFQAFVIGRTEAWPSQSVQEAPIAI
jgi:ABC-2 type transport system ATP-binding protein